MTTPQQFGEYLLFRRLTTDAMGETYRAGKIGSQGIERVVLLRLFNGPSIQAETLWRSIADRMGLQRILQNPHIGDCTDIGRVGNVPFVAYEYVSGKSLAELLEQARSRVFQIPTEHALFIVERLTFGLTAAYSTRLREERIQHGFLVPENVLLSNEGEVRLIGFESGAGQREFLTGAPMREAFGPYVAPEVGPGSPRRPTDDVFALGSLLYELLTGKRLEHPADGNFDPLVDEATLAAEEKPLPPALRALLKSSLAAVGQRIGDIQQWQQAFSRFISEAEYSPTTFNLAFFMHTLFGGEIEQESVDIEREKATQVDVTALAQTTISEPPPGPSDTVLIPPESKAAETVISPPPAAPQGGSGQYGGSPRKPTNWKLFAPFALLAVLGGLAVAYYFSGGLGGDATQNASMPASTEDGTDLAAGTSPLLPPAEGETSDGEALTLDPPADDTAAAAAGGDAVPSPTEVQASQGPSDAIDVASVAAPPTPEEVERQIRDLVAREMEGEMQAKYEEELELLRAQLEEARIAQEEQAAEAARVAQQAAAQPPARESSTPEAATETQAPAQQRAAAAGTEAQASTTDAAASTQAAQQEAEPAVSEPEPAPQKPAQLGDLVEPGVGVTPPQIQQRPSPRYPPGAQRLGKSATIKLRILVDENGRVADVQPDGEPAGFGFDEAAEAAARRTRWSAAQKDGVRVRMWVDLTIAFRPQ